MARTESQMLELGVLCPEFDLPDTFGKNRSHRQLAAANGLLVMFICNHCPYVVHVRQGLIELGHAAAKQNIGVAAISSNDVENYPQDHPDLMRAEHEQFGYPFAYLYDETQEVAKAFKAACTPDFYLFDKDLRLVYRGQMDGSRPGNDVPVTGQDVTAAMTAMVTGQPVAEEQRPSLGCNIKWKPGQEPSYF